MFTSFSKTGISRWRLISCAILLIVGCAGPEISENENQEVTFEIVNFGLYRPVEIDGIDASGNPIGSSSSDQALYTLEQNTDEIPIVPFTRFGFEWCAENYPEGIHRLYLVLEHPSINNTVKSRYATKRIYRRSKTIDNKTEMCSTETWEMTETNLVTGEIWTLGIWDENQALITRDFRFITQSDYFKALE